VPPILARLVGVARGAARAMGVGQPAKATTDDEA